MRREEEQYIGDGVFASFDGYQFWLRTPREFGDHEVALEPSVLVAFNEFVESVKRKSGK